MPDARLEMERSARWVRVHGGSEARRSEALRIASGLQCFLLDAVVSTTDDGSPEAWLESMAAYVDAYPVEGTVAVRAGSRARRFRMEYIELFGSSVCCLSEVKALISKPPTMCWRWWPMGRRLRWLVAGWKGTGKPPFPTVSGELENGRSSNRSALTPCWLVWPSTWQQGRLNVDRWWTR